MHSTKDVDKLAKIVWKYLLLEHKLKKAEVILCLCSLDTRVANRAAELWLGGYGRHLVFSGGTGKLTKDIFQKAEAEIFADIALKHGVPKDKILVENKSSNTGENVLFSYELFQQHGLNPKSMILVQKPYMERRAYATFMKQWPGNTMKIMVTSPQIAYEDYFNESNPKEHVLNIMVGDMQRIREYSKLGYQIEQLVPDNVWAANEELIRTGFTKHLIYS